MKRAYQHVLFRISLLGISLSVVGCSGNDGLMQQTDPLLQELEYNMFRVVNQYRDSAGFIQMVWNDTIASVARTHSKDMALGNVGLSHEGAYQRTEYIRETIPWESISENVAYSTERDDIVDFLLYRWLESNGHKKNIEGEFNLTGIGAAKSPDGKIFFTQIFVLTE